MPQGQSLAPGTDVTSLMSGTDVSDLMGGPKPAVTPKAEEPSSGFLGPIGTILKQAVHTALPVKETLDAVWKAQGDPFTLIGNMVTDVGRAQIDQLKKSYDLYKQGRYVESYGHAIAGVTPIAGPFLADVGEDEAAGKFDIATGKILGGAATMLAPEAAKALTGSRAEAIAAAAERGSTSRLVDVMAPKVGPNKRRFGTMAQQVAPKIAAEPGMGALSRTGLAAKVSDRLSQAETLLDEANDARNPADLIDTSLVTSGLEEKLRKLTATPAEGAEAHEAVAKAGYASTPALTRPAIRAYADLSPAYQAEMRRIAAELKEFQFTDRTTFDTSQDVAREGGFGTGRGARMQAAIPTDKPFAEGAGGAPVYHEILQGKTGTTRNAMIRAIDRYIDDGTPPSPLVQRAITIADQRIRRPDLVSKPMLPLEDFLAPENGPLGKNVIPEPNRPHAQAITQALKEVRALGPMAPYDSLRKIRQAWDVPARQQYVPSLTQDFLKKTGESKGAADVTGVLRDVLSFADPKTAAANKEYALWRKADDVMKATEEVERTRPKVGRQIAARFAGATVGEAAGGGLGAAIGVILGPIVDGVINAGPTVKILTARSLTNLSTALRSGDTAAIETALKRLRALNVVAGAAGRAQK